ncbi:ubiquitin carboxyl-terminal hydrolase 47-like isoform X2 [Clinocottus analis]|uniref:ubiquitin carboxyl-terminal hydrolase 47-like isoform X2 n=1 Tax=Clinocottus analis TaxID=304258 RepID=UPI0035C1D357
MSSSRKRSQNKKAEPKAKKQKVSQRLPHGLHNQGATCYLNSVLQVLSVTREIHDRLESTDQELINFFQNLKKETGETGDITKSLGIENVYQQRDAAECLELILSKISRNASEVFQGQLTYTTKCSRGHIINEETNPFWTLPLSLKDTHEETFSVENGFNTFFQSKLFNGDNMVHCNDCKEKREAESGCQMVVFPLILTLLLKRFELDYNTKTDVKSSCSVDVPRALQTQETGYDLYGMVNHTGSLRGGHYTATILYDDNTWYGFDDTSVHEVEKQPFAETGTYNSSAAYLLVYRASKSPTDEDEQSDSILKQVKAKKKKSDKSGEQRLKEMQREMRDAEHDVVPSFLEDTIQEDVYVPQQTQNTNNSATQQMKMEEGHKNKADRNSRKLCQSSICKLHPFWIALIVFFLVVVLVLVIALPIVYA